MAPRSAGPELERLAVQLAKVLWRLGPDGHARALELGGELVAMRDGGSDRFGAASPGRSSPSERDPGVARRVPSEGAPTRTRTRKAAAAATLLRGYGGLADDPSGGFSPLRPRTTLHRRAGPSGSTETRWAR
jgi:hypothetical protein